MRLAVLTTGRQDWGLLRPLCGALAADPVFELRILAGGMACSVDFGRVVDSIRDQGFDVAAELDWKAEVHDAIGQSAAAVSMVGGALGGMRPDALVLLGDRYETAAAALAATLVGVPIVHLYGGEETEGAVDNVLRHAITKLSHLHFVAHQRYADRILQMGEDPSSVHVVGSLGVDNLLKQALPDREELERFLGIKLARPVGLVTVHPTTLTAGPLMSEADAVIGAMKNYPATWIVTLPNADPGHESIRDAFLGLADESASVVATVALGEERYLGLMKLADFVLGNSSSGLTEAPSLRVPTINVGDRQKGRIRSPSVMDVRPETDAILAALRKAESRRFRASVAAQPMPFGSGGAASCIVAVLRDWRPPSPPRKVFHAVSLLPVGPQGTLPRGIV
jgi:UDP-hydrolysing UDP-N-acetyl-D-glucosamine 2-epimerase